MFFRGPTGGTNCGMTFLSVEERSASVVFRSNVTSGFKPNSPKSCTRSRVKVPPLVSGKEYRGSRSRTRCSWACAVTAAWGPQFSAARRRSSVLFPRGRQVSRVTESPLGCLPRADSGTHLPRARGPPPGRATHAQTLPPGWPGAVQQSALPLGAGPARAHARRDPRPQRGGGG